jgi:hypothetical protein
VFIAALQEAARGSDSFSVRLLWEVINDSQTVSWQNIGSAQTPVWGVVNAAQTVSWQNIDNAQPSGWGVINDAQTTNWVVINTQG